MGWTQGALLVSLLYVGSTRCGKSERARDRIKQRIFVEWLEQDCDRIRLRRLQARSGVGSTRN